MTSPFLPTRSKLLAAALIGTLSLGLGLSLAHARGFDGAGMFERLDRNGDGEITRAEIEAARAQRIEAYDIDNDGELDRREYTEMVLDQARDRANTRFDRLDDDNDGFIGVREMTARFDRMIERLDKNGDGALSRAELRGLRHDRGGFPGPR